MQRARRPLDLTRQRQHSQFAQGDFKRVVGASCLVRNNSFSLKRRVAAVPMNPAMVNIIAALSGTVVGSLAPVLSSYVLQRSLTQRDLLNRQLGQREALYSDFIKEASRLYVDAMIHELGELNDLVSLYALVSRIRLLASAPVVSAAEDFVRLIVRHYGEPNLTVEEIRSSALEVKADPLDVFSFACRKELRDLLQRGESSATIRA